MRELFWTTADLLAAGRTKRQIAAAADAGLMLPVRRGLWASREAPPGLVRIARTGGAATATSALAELGLFVPPDDRVHIAFSGSTGRRHDPDGAGDLSAADPGVCAHWSARMPSPRTLPDRVAPLLLVLEHTVHCLRPELAVAVLDSAVHERVLRVSQLSVLARALPRHLQDLVDAVDGRSDSGVESVARVLLRNAGLAVVVHALLPEIGEVDLLVEGVLIIEVDGRRFHTGERAFDHDRRRDREAARQGYRVLRFTYRQIMFEWPECLRAIRTVLAQAA